MKINSEREKELGKSIEKIMSAVGTIECDLNYRSNVGVKCCLLFPAFSLYFWDVRLQLSLKAQREHHCWWVDGTLKL